MLEAAGGALELVDASDVLPDLARRPGLTSWTVMNKAGTFFSRPEDLVDEMDRKHISASMFPRPPEASAALHLEHCVRILPHLQNSGGFFIAVFEKKAPHGSIDRLVERARQRAAAAASSSEVEMKEQLQAELAEEAAAAAAVVAAAAPVPTEIVDDLDMGDESVGNTAKPVKVTAYDKRPSNDPFVFLAPTDEIVTTLTAAYEFDGRFPTDMLLQRSEAGSTRHIYVVSSDVKRVLQSEQQAKLRIIQTGTRIFARTAEGKSKDARPVARYRIMQDGLPFVRSFIKGLRIEVQRDDFILLLKNHQPLSTQLSAELQARLEQMTTKHGHMLPMIFVYEPSTVAAADGNSAEPRATFVSSQIVLCGFLARKTAQVLVNKQQRESLLARFGVELGDFQTAPVNPKGGKNKAEEGASSDEDAAAEAMETAAIAPADAGEQAADNDEQDEEQDDEVEGDNGGDAAAETTAAA
eukprot:Unigene10301_Nuclearia_a/m.31449 Unigene10301_Nuclearia_a/g.31449  ORF Unigene10301_Nuclearia_a/g.31449 Unigene10301_Nuclearia_a/m.31449 type:complete len:468 (+) Unigene10301_Nuclearia_a:1049-2452(+)